MYRPRLRALFSCVLVLFTFATVLVAASDRPFRARLHVTQSGPPAPDARCPAPMVLVEFTGSGTAIRMGRVTIEASHCIIDDPADPNFVNGEAILSSARGDVFIRYRGTDTGGELNGTFEIVGGTGAFAGATGGGTLSGTVSADTGEGDVTLDGTIVTP